MCYECKKLGHFKVDCPTLKKSFKRTKKKAMVATWSDSDESSSKEETQNKANFYLMALDDEVIFEPSLEFIFDEL